MYVFKESFPELFDHICSYLPPRDLIALSTTAHEFVEYYPRGFSQWRRNIIAINAFILTINHQIKPHPNPIVEHFPIDAGTSIVRYSNKYLTYIFRQL